MNSSFPLAAALLASLLLRASPSSAQSTSTEQTVHLDAYEVTGSRIKRLEGEAPRRSISTRPTRSNKAGR